MDEIIEKYRKSLQHYDERYEEAKHLIDPDTTELLHNFRIIIVMIITDLEAIKALVGTGQLKISNSFKIDISKIIGDGEPWPLKDVLNNLVNASEILLHKHDYDGAKYEEINICVARGKEIIKLLN